MINKMKSWKVRVHRAGVSTTLGSVTETTESLARCAALSKYAICDDDESLRRDSIANSPRGILPDDDFDVTPT